METEVNLPFPSLAPYPHVCLLLFFFFFQIVVVSEMNKELKRENEIVKMVDEERAAKAGSYFLYCDKDSLLIA